MKTLIALAITLFSANSFAADLICGGTEPFWDATVKNGALTFNNPEIGKPVALKILSTADAAGYAAGNISVISTKYSRLTIVAGKCNDGMSPTRYSHHAVLEVNGMLLGGCCQIK